MLIGVKRITNRVRYIFNLLLQENWGLSIRFTEDPEEFKASEEPKISYSFCPEGSGLHFAAHPLLFEDFIAPQEIDCFSDQNFPAFFKQTEDHTALPFDVFAAAFYLVSRYEEYLPHTTDPHGRYLALQSLAFQKGFLQIPLVDYWIERIGKLISDTYPALKVRPRSYRFVASIDIDHPFAFRHKPLIFTLGRFIKTGLKGNFQAINNQLQALCGKKQDPFDTFDVHLQLQEKYGFETRYFILTANYGGFDKNRSVGNKYFKNLVPWLDQHAVVGIHPSYTSNSKPTLVAREIERLEKMVKRPISHSRQHFLKLRIPETYRTLIAQGILHEYTMGYAEQPGFRASISTPFRFFDLENNVETPLTVHPFAFMEETFSKYLKIPPEASWDSIESLIAVIKKANGTFIPLWHNDTFHQEEWFPVYQKMIEAAV